MTSFYRPLGTEKFQTATTSIFGEGVVFGEIDLNGFECALSGKTFPIKEKLKELGFRFDGGSKSWYLKGGYPAMSTLLNVDWKPMSI